MKIMFLSAASSIHTVRWVNSLASKGHEIHLVYLPNHEQKENKISKDVYLHKLKISGNKGYYFNKFELRNIFERVKPDVVNAHYASGYGTLARISRLEPLLISVWGSDIYDFPYKNKLNMMIIKKNLNYADQIASTSYCMAEQIKKVLKEEVNINITPFGVDTNVFKPLENIEKNKNFTFGIVKTLSEKYGIKYLIKSFKLVLDVIEKEKVNIEPILEIYGKGPQEQELKKLSFDLGISEKVKFNGYIKNDRLPVVLNKIDILCLSSILDSESFGVAAVEAMACGIPVIASDVDGFKEVIENNVTGYIVKRKNEEILAEKMYELMLNRKKREEMGKEGIKRVKNLYDWNDNIKNMELIYSECIGN